MTKKKATVALAGNPNSGKTTVFNNITGARQHVGNWPGVTVEKKEGIRNFKGYDIKVVDLPGVYSLTAYSLDEVIARDYIVYDKPDVDLESRNEYLAISNEIDFQVNTKPDITNFEEREMFLVSLIMVIAIIFVGINTYNVNVRRKQINE